MGWGGEIFLHLFDYFILDLIILTKSRPLFPEAIYM